MTVMWCLRSDWYYILLQMTVWRFILSLMRTFPTLAYLPAYTAVSWVSGWGMVNGTWVRSLRSLFHRKEIASVGKPWDKSLFPNMGVTFVSYVCQNILINWKSYSVEPSIDLWYVRRYGNMTFSKSSQSFIGETWRIFSTTIDQLSINPRNVKSEVCVIFCCE